MKRVVRKHLRDFVAIVSLLVMAVAVGGFIIVSQGTSLPSWVPGFGEEFYEVRAEFRTAQAVVPGQGQSVKIAGVSVGEIAGVELEDGHAVVSMKIKRDHPMYRDAKMLLAPTTLVKDENIDLDPGTKKAGRVPEGGTLPQSQTRPDVNLDEILSVLDRDTREYLQIMLASLGEGLGKNGRNLRGTFNELRLTTLYIDRINGKIAERRRNLKRLIHNFQLVLMEVGSKDEELAQLVDSVNATFQSFAEEDDSLKEAVRLLPDTLKTTEKSLRKADRLARLLGPTLSGLRPGARALKSSLEELRPFFEETEPVISKQLRPFAREAAEPVANLRPAASRLTDIVPDAGKAVSSLNYLFNELAFNSGKDLPFSFWAAWTSHNLASAVSSQDANGVLLRGLLVLRCFDLQIMNNFAPNPSYANMKLLIMSLGLPDMSKVC